MFLFDAVFNGLDVLAFGAVLALAGLARWALRHDAVREAREHAERATRPPDRLDAEMDELFGEDAFAWPARR